MNQFIFTVPTRIGQEIFHASLTDPGTYTINWYERDGHAESGNVMYSREKVEGYLADGVWLIVNSVETMAATLGIARPVLETRKVGKVQVHMVDQGFPNALMEVAKVMTWAADVKGYKLHDWKNIPDAQNAFQGAASRHRMLYNIQRMHQGLPALECTDQESELVHKAHEAFNVLAELELILTKKIV